MYRRKKIFWLACLAIFFFGVAITTLGSLAPRIKVMFDLDDEGMGALFSILPLGILAGSLVFGPVCDRHGYRSLLALACFCMAAGFWGIAGSPDMPLMRASVFLFGLGGGVINGATSALVSDISVADKGANLSILGVFFSAGALGMPFILGILEKFLGYTALLMIISAVTSAIGILYFLTKFPAPKQQQALSFSAATRLIKNPFLLTIALFLFFQSAYEGILNNWTPTYLSDYIHTSREKSLFALTLGVGGMTIMRLLLGSVFRRASSVMIWTITFAAMAAGLLFLLFGVDYLMATTGFVLMGVSLAAGFPIMLGYLGTRFPDLSGTAFGIVFAVALIGNTLNNYVIGITAKSFGIRNLVYIGVVEFMLMLVLCLLVLRKMDMPPNEG